MVLKIDFLTKPVQFSRKDVLNRNRDVKIAMLPRLLGVWMHGRHLPGREVKMNTRTYMILHAKSCEISSIARNSDQSRRWTSSPVSPSWCRQALCHIHIPRFYKTISNILTLRTEINIELYSYVIYSSMPYPKDRMFSSCSLLKILKWLSWGLYPIFRQSHMIFLLLYHMKYLGKL